MRHINRWLFPVNSNVVLIHLCKAAAVILQLHAIIQFLHGCIAVGRNISSRFCISIWNNRQVDIGHKEIAKDGHRSQLICDVPYHIAYIQETACTGAAAQAREDMDVHRRCIQICLCSIDFLLYTVHKNFGLIHHHIPTNLANTTGTSFAKVGHINVFPSQPRKLIAHLHGFDVAKRLLNIGVGNREKFSIVQRH